MTVLADVVFCPDVIGNCSPATPPPPSSNALRTREEKPHDNFTDGINKFMNDTINSPESDNTTTSGSDDGQGGNGTSSDNNTVLERALGFTVDLKTGLYAYVNFAGFYVDTQWLGTKPKGSVGGLYWPIKSLVAKCVPCVPLQPPLGDGVNCMGDLAGIVDRLFYLDVIFNGMITAGAMVLDKLMETNHDGDTSIDSLDNQIIGDDMPSGHADKACYARPIEEGKKGMALVDREGDGWIDDHIRHHKHDEDDDMCQEKAGGGNTTEAKDMIRMLRGY